MTYRIRFRNSGSIHDSQPSTLEEARSIAVSLSNWNQRVDLIDLETGEILHSYKPWSEAGAQMVETASEKFVCQICGTMWFRAELIGKSCGNVSCGGTVEAA